MARRPKPAPQQQEVRNLMLTGKSPRAAANKIDKYRPDRLARNTTQNVNIVTENRINFLKVGADELMPYKVLREAMETATITRKETESWEEPLYEGGVIVGIQRRHRDVNVVVPDWTTRMNAAKQYCLMCGYSPKDAPVVQISTNGDSVISFGNLYANIGRVKDPEAALTEYNRLQQQSAQGELDSIPILDVEYTELPE